MFQLGGKMDNFRKKSTDIFLKKLNSVKKTLLFSIKKLEKIYEYQKLVRGLADIGIRNGHLWLPNRGDAHMLLLINLLTALQ